jgi:hypothetical protein
MLPIDALRTLPGVAVVSRGAVEIKFLLLDDENTREDKLLAADTLLYGIATI